MRLFIILILTVALASCTSMTSKKSLESVTLLFTANRHLELEPCGCSIFPKGGVEREFEAIQKETKTGNHLLIFSTGTHFLPTPEEYKRDLKSHYLRKSEYVLTSLAALGYQAISPSVSDLSLGKEQILKLNTQSSVPFVSSNLVYADDRPIFSRTITKQVGSKLVGIIGLSTDEIPQPYGKMPSWAKVLPTPQAIELAMKDFKKRPDLVIVLSSRLQWDEIENKQAYQQVNLVLGGNIDEPTNEVHQIGKSLLHFNPEGKGRSLARITIAISGENNFQHSYLTEVNKKTVGNWDKKINALKKEQIRSDSADQEVERLSHFRNRLHLSDVAIVKDNFSYETIFLDKKFKPTTPNKLSQIMTQYKDMVRQLALEE